MKQWPKCPSLGRRQRKKKPCLVRDLPKGRDILEGTRSWFLGLLLFRRSPRRSRQLLRGSQMCPCSGNLEEWSENLGARRSWGEIYILLSFLG